MPILKANEPMPQRPVVIALYGEPGSCKTTLGNTAENVLVLDFDRGVSRSFHRQDTLIINSWEDVLAEERLGTFKNYKTVVIDTAKAALDDFLMSYVTSQDYKLKANKLKAYGEIGDSFKLFLNNRRNEGLDVIIIAHAKKDEDTKKSIPDVTGQSYQLILRVADQVGYVSFINNDRNIQWTPTDLTVGKNTANLPTMKVPDKTEPELKQFMANVIKNVKESIAAMSDAQKEAIKELDQYQERLAAAETPEDLTALLAEVNTKAQYIKAPMVKLIVEKAGKKGYVANKELKRYELPPAQPAQPETPAPAAQEATAAAPETPAAPQAEQDPDEVYNGRIEALKQAGATLNVEDIQRGEVVASYDEIAEMDNESFKALLQRVMAAAPAAKPRRTRPVS